MARIDPRVGAIAYLVGRSQQQAAKFIKEKAKQLPHAKIVNQVEDLPRRRGLSIVLLPGYDKRMDYELLFGESGLFCIFAANIRYWHEV
jgi:hypothetical protein